VDAEFMVPGSGEGASYSRKKYETIILNGKSMAILGTDLLEVPTIYKAYFLGLCKGISPQNMA